MTEFELAMRITDGIINATSGLVTYLTQMKAIRAEIESAKASGTLHEMLDSLSQRSDAADAELRQYLGMN